MAGQRHTPRVAQRDVERAAALGSQRHPFATSTEQGDGVDATPSGHLGAPPKLVNVQTRALHAQLEAREACISQLKGSLANLVDEKRRADQQMEA